MDRETFGTYSVAFMKTSNGKVFSDILKGSSICETTEVRLEQPKNAPTSMVVTLFGIVTEVRPEQP